MNAAALLFIHFPIITGRVSSSHEGGADMGVWGFILLALFAVAVAALLWFALTDAGNAAWTRIVRTVRKERN